MGRFGRWSLAWLGLAAAAPLWAAKPKVVTSLDVRLRGETTETPSGPSASVARDRSYSFANARARLGLELAWPRWSVAGVLQGAGSTGLPDNAAFGPGQAYFNANLETSPSQLGIAELALTYSGDKARVVLGRQRYGEGFEVPTGVAYLDGIKRRRLAERLVGNWDWPNVGRRFDGASFGWSATPEGHLAGFALRPLAGGINYRDAFEELDDLSVYGLTWTARYGSWLPKGEVRLFAIRYDDARPGAVRAAGGELSLDTYGTSLLAGDDNNDLLVWAALQRGDWGPRRQDAWAAMIEAGHRFQGPGKPVVRAGAARASGDGPGASHGTFWSLLPTKHKFHGILDYSTFLNLETVYTEVLASPTERLSVRVGFDNFALADRGDAWYGGSGAFDEAALGFTPRRPARGAFESRDIGREVSLEATVKLRKGVELDLGGALFLGGAAAAQVLPVAEDGRWAFVQLRWQR